MQARKTVQGKIVEKKIVCRTDEQIKLVQKLVKENCSSVRGLTQTEALIILDIMRKPNSVIVCYVIKTKKQITTRTFHTQLINTYNIFFFVFF